MSPLVEVAKIGPDQALQVSKSRKLPLLIDVDEMESLFSVLGVFEIYDVSRPIDREKAVIHKDEFLRVYQSYTEGIKCGELIDEAFLRPYFSSVIASSPEDLYALALSNGKHLIKARRPIIQLQRHHFIYSDTFYSGVMGEGSVTWGIQFSYPQLYLNPETKAIGKIEKNGDFPNTELFQKLAKWVRNETAPTPFIVNGKKVNQPIRLGKRCFDWIHSHPSLQAKGVHVEARTYS